MTSPGHSGILGSVPRPLPWHRPRGLDCGVPPTLRAFRAGRQLVNVVVGLAVFLAWALDIDGLKSVFPGTVTMKANTALLFTISGAALWLAAARQDRRAVRALAAVVVVVAAATLAEYALGRSLGVDQLLIRDRAPVPLTAPPGRMGINTGIAFVFTRVALMLSAAGRLGAPWLAQWLALSSAALGAVSLISYARARERRLPRRGGERTTGSAGHGARLR